MEKNLRSFGAVWGAVAQFQEYECLVASVFVSKNIFFPRHGDNEQKVKVCIHNIDAT